MMTVKKMVNAMTGEVRYELTHLRPIDYEFECEALADYKFGVKESQTNKEAEKALLS